MAGEDQWEPISRAGTPEVTGPNRQEPALLEWRVRLSRRPDPGWGGCFKNPRPSKPFSLMASPDLTGQYVSFSVEADENALRRYVQHIDERITAANKLYEKQVLAAMRADEDRAREQQESAEQHLREAQQMADDLNLEPPDGGDGEQ